MFQPSNKYWLLAPNPLSPSHKSNYYPWILTFVVNESTMLYNPPNNKQQPPPPPTPKSKQVYIVLIRLTTSLVDEGSSNTGVSASTRSSNPMN